MPATPSERTVRHHGNHHKGPAPRPRPRLRRPPLRRRPGRGRARHRPAAALSAALRGDGPGAVRAGDRHHHDGRHRRGPGVHARVGPVARPRCAEHGRGGVDAGAGGGRGTAAGRPVWTGLAVRGGGALPRDRQPGVAGRPRGPRGHRRPRPRTRRRTRGGPLPAQCRPGRGCAPRHRVPGRWRHRIAGAGGPHRNRFSRRGGIGVVGPRAGRSGRRSGHGQGRRARTTDADPAGRQRDLRLLPQRPRDRAPLDPGDPVARVADVDGSHLRRQHRAGGRPAGAGHRPDVPLLPADRARSRRRGTRRVLPRLLRGHVTRTRLGRPGRSRGVGGLHPRRDPLRRQRHRPRHPPCTGPWPWTRPRPLPVLHGLRPGRLPGDHHRPRLTRLSRPLGQPDRSDTPVRLRRRRREGHG